MMTVFNITSTGFKNLFHILTRVKFCHGYGYVKFIITVEELLANYDDHLYYKATCDNHCLHHLLPVAKSNKYGLRDIGHGSLIDQVTTELHKRTFINRILFSNCY